MLKDFLEYFEYDGRSAEQAESFLKFGAKEVPIVNDIPRFTPTESYSSGNFARLRNEHAKLQLDSINGTTDRRDTLLWRTGWDPSFLAGKTVLECGCGAGPDSEVLLSLGAKVLSVDLAGLDVARDNIGPSPRHALVQANIVDLPLKKRSFDIVFCHRVLQHTPSPEKTLRHILQFVQPGGAVFVHSYARTIYQMLRWKYVLRPLTKRLPSEFLYNTIKLYAPLAYRITNSLNRRKIGQILSWGLVPFLNYSHLNQFSGKGDDWFMELAIHDTFDALSPPFDSPLSARKMSSIAREILSQPFEVVEYKTITLLRTTSQIEIEAPVAAAPST